MNNSQIAQDALIGLLQEAPSDRLPILRKRETELTELIEALDHIRSSNYWKVIQRHFAKDLERLVIQLKREKDTTEIFRLQGEITRAEKLDLDKTTESYRQELSGVRKQLQSYD